MCEKVDAHPEDGLHRSQFIALYTGLDLIDKIAIHFSTLMQDEDGNPVGDMDSVDPDSIDDEDDI